MERLGHMPQDKDISIAAIVRYDNARDTQGDFDKIKTFFDLYAATITDCEAKAQARAARTQEALTDAKQRAPMWYTGGACFGTHNADNVDPIGVIAIDADDINQDRQPEIKRRLSEIPCIFFCAQSISGRGLYALASVSIEVQRDPDRVVKFLGLIDAAVLPDRQDGEHIDTACKDIARRRFESYDPACYFDPEKFTNEYTGEYRSKCRDAFSRTQLAALAQLFGGRGDKSEGSAQAGLALAALAVSAGGRVSGRLFTKDFYPARAQVVVLGASGDGKSTAANALRRAANAIGARPVSAESDRALEAALVESGLKKTPTDGEEEWEQICPPVPLLSITDEAGDEQASRRSREYKSKLNSIKRRTFDCLFHASASLTTKLPQKDFHCSYTDVQLSTPKRWADALRGTDATTGERRRVLEFWAASVKAPDGALNPMLAEFMASEIEPVEPANVDAITAVLDDLKDSMPAPDRECTSVYLDGYKSMPVFEQLEALEEMQRIGAGKEAIQDVRTILCGLATLIAWSDRLPRITPDAIRAAWSVVFAVYENRARLQEAAEVGAITQEAEISGEILEYIGARELRISSVKRMLARRGGAYSRAFTALIDAGALIVTKGKSATVRAATDAEAEAASERSETERQTKKQCPSVWDGQTTAAAKPYDQCDEVEKLQRLAKYRDEFEQDKPIVEGQRDNHLRALRYQLEKTGMWDGTAEQWLRDVCGEVGFTRERDQKRLCRPIRGGV